MPQVADPAMTEEPLLDFNSGYVLRSLARTAQTGLEGAVEAAPELPVDLRMLRRGALADGTMQFSRGAAAPTPPEAEVASSGISG